MREQIRPGVWLSRPDANADELTAMHANLVELLRAAHAKDVDLSGLISGALMQLADELPGGPREVIIHRNGSWEAEHVFRLAGGY